VGRDVLVPAVYVRVLGGWWGLLHALKGCNIGLSGGVARMDCQFLRPTRSVTSLSIWWNSKGIEQSQGQWCATRDW